MPQPTQLEKPAERDAAAAQVLGVSTPSTARWEIVGPAPKLHTGARPCPARRRPAGKGRRASCLLEPPAGVNPEVGAPTPNRPGAVGDGAAPSDFAHHLQDRGPWPDSRANSLFGPPGQASIHATQKDCQREIISGCRRWCARTNQFSAPQVTLRKHHADRGSSRPTPLRATLAHSVARRPWTSRP